MVSKTYPDLGLGYFSCVPPRKVWSGPRALIFSGVPREGGFRGFQKIFRRPSSTKTHKRDTLWNRWPLLVPTDKKIPCLCHPTHNDAPRRKSNSQTFRSRSWGFEFNPHARWNHWALLDPPRMADISYPIHGWRCSTGNVGVSTIMTVVH